MHKVYDDWHEAARTGPVSIECRAQARLAACWATEVALAATQFAMFAADSNGVRNQEDGNTLQRVFRDMQAGATHRHVDQETLIECTQVELGVADPPLEL